MRQWLRRFLGRHVVDEVPDEMSACLNCEALHCSDERWATCPHRLAEAAALRALRQSQKEEVSRS